MIKLIQNNPYRFLGVYSNSPIKDRVANINKLKAYLKVGKQLSFPLDMPDLLEPFSRTIEGMEASAASLNLPKDQIKHALFWFVNITPFDKIALDYLQAGNAEKCKEISSKKETISSLINLGVLAGVEDELGTLISNVTKVIHNDDYREEFLKAVAGDEFQMSEEDLAVLFIDSLQEEMEISKLRDLFANYGASAADDELLDSRAIEEPKSQILSAISEAKDVANTANAQYEAGVHLMDVTKGPLKLLQDMLDTDDMGYQTIADKLATQILQCGINYYNKSDEDEDEEIKKAYKLQHYALTIAAGNLVKERCKENVAILNKKKKELAPKGVRFYDQKIKEILASFAAKPDKAKETTQLVKGCAPYLFSIKDELGSNNEYYLRMSTLVVAVGLSKVIEEFNSMMNDTLKIQLMLHREATLNKLRCMFNDAWEATLFMEKLDMESNFRLNRFNDQKIALRKQVAELIDVNTQVRLSAQSDNQMFASCSDISSFQKYLSMFAKGKHVAEAMAGIERCEFEAISTSYRCSEFLKKYPHTRLPVAEKQEELFYKECQSSVNWLNRYLKEYPSGRYVSQAKARLEEESMWAECLASEGKEKYKEYLSKYPNGVHRKEAEQKASACYIATMVYGDYDHPQVVALRSFRDDILRTNAIGRAFISFYYKNSPAWVEKLQDYRGINIIIRKVLNIFIKLYNYESK